MFEGTQVSSKGRAMRSEIFFCACVWCGGVAAVKTCCSLSARMRSSEAQDLQHPDRRRIFIHSGHNWSKLIASPATFFSTKWAHRCVIYVFASWSLVSSPVWGLNTLTGVVQPEEWKGYHEVSASTEFICIMANNLISLEYFDYIYFVIGLHRKQVSDPPPYGHTHDWSSSNPWEITNV